MLRRSPLLQCIVQYATICTTAGRLNELLDMRRRKEGPVQRSTLEKFLRDSVIPLLRGTELDRRHDSGELRRSLSQLLRDAAFAAVVLRASATGSYVSALVECIKHDHERMKLISKMTSNQASRIIEHLCRTGVRDNGVYASLASRLDFNVLKEVGRAMFALAEEGMHLEVVSFIVPLYCGETWSLTFDGGGGQREQGKGNCTVFDAVRILRVLSKSVRGVVEQKRLDQHKGTIYPLPVESIQRLRTSLTDFIIQNSSTLRGAHWVNFTRAMVHFPEEFKTMKYLEQCSAVVRAVDAVRFTQRSSRWRLSEFLSTDDLALLGMDRVFAPVEKQQEKLHGVKSGKTLFDLQATDLSKLLSIIEDVPLPRAIQQRRLELVIQAIVDEMDSLSFADLVRFLQSLRKIEGTASFAPALDAAAVALSRRLTIEIERIGRENAEYIPYKRFVQLATLLSAFRVKSCKGFATYLSQILPDLPSISVEDATSLMNALATISSVDGVEMCAHVGEKILEKLSVDGELVTSALLLVYPVSCARLLRAAVLLSAMPPSSVITRIFGNPGEKLMVSMDIRAAGASVLFDVARSLYHFCRVKPADAACEEMLWSRGVAGALMPLLTQLTRELHDECMSAHAWPRRATYVPIAWRSTMEAIFPYVDVNLDVVPLETMHQRISNIYPFCRDILITAVDIVETQCHTLENNPSVESIAFSSNSMIHFVFFLLMLEHMLYHGTWQAEICGGTPVSKDVLEKLRLLKADYNELLSTPLKNDDDDDKRVSILSRIKNLLSSAEKKGAQSSPFFDRSSVLEITTNLPFAVSLVVEQGPINELLCEQALAVMLQTDN